MRISPLHLVLVCGLMLAATPVLAQPDTGRDNPVFVNDSPTAADAILKAQENVAGANFDQAVRVLQKLLDEEPFALVQSTADPLLYLCVRERALALIAGDKVLLETYRRAQEPLAAEGLRRSEFALVERARLLTPSGLVAALAVAADHIEHARFHAALMSLEAIENHPDRAASPSAAKVARTLTAYLPTERARGLARRMGAEPAEPVNPPAIARATSPMSALAPADLTGIVAQPLAAEIYTTEEPIDTPRFAPAADGARPRRPLGTFPTVSGDSIFLSSSRHITALDRFTLREKWRLDVQSLLAGVSVDRAAERDGFGNRNFRGPVATEDASRVVVRAGTLLCTAATPAIPGEDQREVLLGLDAISGRVKWRLTPGEIDPSLSQASIRGQILAEGDIAVITFRKDVPQRRVTALHAAAVSVAEGRPLWSRLVGSIGSLPWNRGPTHISDGGVLDSGVLYRPDRLGLIAAYSIADGRPLWVRRLSADLWESSSPAQMFASSVPVVHGTMLTTLSPDRRQIITLDRQTGAIVSTIASEVLGRPSYLLTVGQMLVGVGESRVAVTPLTGAAPGQTHVSATLGEQNPLAGPGSAGTIRGRVVVAGDKLLVPTDKGVLTVNPADLTAKPVETLLDRSGNLVYDDGQLLTCDDARVFSYLAWNEADRLLTSRVKDNPADAASGVALAELAHRAGHPERIVFGADAALAALGAKTTDGLNTDRARLALALRTMIESAQDPADTKPARVTATNPATAATAQIKPLVGDLVVRLAMVATTPEEKSAFFLLKGTHEQEQGRAEAAAQSFQSVLDDPDLAGAPFVGRQIALRAETEATRRLEKLVFARGRPAYAAIDAKVDDAIRALGQGVSVDELEKVARRYPVARQTPALWARIATAHKTGGRERAAARALEMGLQSSERMPDAPPAVVGELAGTLVASFQERGLDAAANETLRRVKTRFGAQIAFTAAGKPLETERLSTELAARIALLQRWPRIGHPTAEGVQALAGWMVMDPLILPVDGASPGGVVMVNQEREVALFAPRVPEGGGAETLEPIWTFQPGTDEVRLVKLDSLAAYLFVYGSRSGGTLLKVDLATGQRTWKSQPLASYFDEEHRKIDVERFRHPLGALLSTDTIIATIDERTAVLVERSGRVIALDSDSGALLWAAMIPVERVFDATVNGNLLALAGDRLGKGDQESWIPTVMMLDSRTGQVVQQYLPTKGIALGGGPAGAGDGDGRARWLRISSRGDLLAGLDGGVVSLDPETGQELWRQNDPPALRSLGAWLRGESLFIIAEDHQLHQAALATGALRAPAVDTRGRMLSDTEVQPFATAEGNLAICSAQGVAIVSSAGLLIAADSLGANDNLLTPVPGSGVFVTMETGTSSAPPAPLAAAQIRAPRNIGLGIQINQGGEPREPAMLAYTLHMIDAKTGVVTHDVSVMLGDAPTHIALMDGRVLITAGRTTIAFRAPAAK